VPLAAVSALALAVPLASIITLPVLATINWSPVPRALVPLESPCLPVKVKIAYYALFAPYADCGNTLTISRYLSLALEDLPRQE